MLEMRFYSRGKSSGTTRSETGVVTQSLSLVSLGTHESYSGACALHTHVPRENSQLGRSAKQLANKKKSSFKVQRQQLQPADNSRAVGPHLTVGQLKGALCRSKE